MHICDDCKQVTYAPIHYVLGTTRCKACSDKFQSTWRENALQAMRKQTDAHECNVTDDVCQECCEHFEFDHYICLDCGYEKCPGEDIDAAEYHLDPER